ncbi:mediator complex subunit Med18 [Xylaria nigripes]|nr:mediator complex subunit Med18 [Xylaria nigripes]
MHELFLTASVAHEDFEVACSILSGMCWMLPHQSTHRILFFKGPPYARGLPNPPQSGTQARPLERQLWNDLNSQLLRTSYVMQGIYDISRTDVNKEIDLTRRPAILRWTDFPDPSRDSPITSRKKIDIAFQGGLSKTMAENKHTCTSELIQECFSFNKGNLEIVLSRYYYPPEPNANSVSEKQSWLKLRPVDNKQNWVMNIKLNVIEDSQPEKLAKANEELMKSKAEFDKIFDFKIVDRRAFDSRIPNLAYQ